MIREIRIQNLGVIDDAVLELSAGLNVVTGETGAGKTMVVSGLGLLLGARADVGLVRAGAKAAVVEGVVEVGQEHPASLRAVEVVVDAEFSGVMWCDGSRTVELPPGARVDVCRSKTPVRLARLTSWPFADRLVAKFDLSVDGWRGATRRNAGGSGRAEDVE